MATIDTNNLPSMDHMDEDSKNLVLAVLDWAAGKPVLYQSPSTDEFKPISKAKFKLGRLYKPVPAVEVQEV